MTALSLFLLIAMIGLVVDLGYLYTRKTELQNAADAAALAGARELNGTTAGVIAAANSAIALAGANNLMAAKNSQGTTAVEIRYENIMFGPTPDEDGEWYSYEDASDEDSGLAAVSHFIKVDTSGIDQGRSPTWFMGVVSAALAKTDTFGMAVAGRYIVDVAPMAACALDGSTTKPCSTANCGYEAGKSYALSKINPIGPGTIYWIDPQATGPGGCASDTKTTLPFVCQGRVAAPVASASTVYTNTGLSAPQLEALDSRFNEYGQQAKCDPTTAPPDQNIKEYSYNDAAVAAWMSPAPKDYISSIDGETCKANKGECQASRVTGSPPSYQVDDGGVMWSFVRPQGDIPASSRMPTASYPANGTPYANRSDSKFYTPGPNGAFQRRVMNMFIVDCPSSGGVCQPAKVLGIGRFLMQRKSNVPSDMEIYVEFGEMVQALPTEEVKLYR